MTKKLILFLTLFVCIISVDVYATTTIGSLNDYAERERFYDTIRTKQSAPSSITEAGEEHINLFSGNVAYVKTELSLPGKGGHDLVIRRSFDSGENKDVEGQTNSITIARKSSPGDLGDFVKYAFPYYRDGDTSTAPLYIGFDSVYDMLQAENGQAQIYLSEDYANNLTGLGWQERRKDDDVSPFVFYWSVAKNGTNMDMKGQFLLYDKAPLGDVVFKRDTGSKAAMVYGNSAWTYVYTLNCFEEAYYYIGNGWNYMLPLIKNLEFDYSDGYEIAKGSFYDSDTGHAMDFYLKYIYDAKTDKTTIGSAKLYSYDDEGKERKSSMYSITFAKTYGDAEDCIVIERYDGVKFIFEGYDGLKYVEDRHENRITYNIDYKNNCIDIVDTFGRKVNLSADGVQLNGMDIVTYTLGNKNNSAVDPKDILTEDNEYSLTAKYYKSNSETKTVKYNISERPVKVLTKISEYDYLKGIKQTVAGVKTVIDSVELNSGGKYCYEYSPVTIVKNNNQTVYRRTEEDYGIKATYQLLKNSSTAQNRTTYDYSNSGSTNLRTISYDGRDNYSVSETYDAFGCLTGRVESDAELGYTKTDEYAYTKLYEGNYVPSAHTSTVRNNGNTAVSTVEYTYDAKTGKASGIARDGAEIYSAHYGTYGIPTYTANKTDDTYWSICSNVYSSSYKEISKTVYYSGKSLDTIKTTGDETVSYTYNSYGDLKSKTESGITAYYSYGYYNCTTSTGKTVEVRTKTDSTTVVDDDGNLITDVVETKTLYDIFGNPVSYTDGKGGVTTMTYDRLGRLLETVRPGGITASVQYIDALNYIIETNELGGKKRYDFDSLGRNTYGYTLDTDKNSYKTDYFCLYDAQGRMYRQRIYVDGIVKAYVDYDYYDNGSVKSEEVANNAHNTLSYQEYEYNAVPEENVFANFTRIQKGANEYVIVGNYTDRYGRKLKDTLGNTLTSTVYEQNYTTDLQGNILTVKDFKTAATSSRNTLAYTYDTRYRVTDETDGDGTVYTTYQGDLVTKVRDRRGSDTVYTYDERGLEASVKNALGGMTYKYYDYNGNLARVEVQTGNTYAVTEYRYDSNNRLITAITHPYDNLMNVTKYEYDAAGNVTRMATGLTEPDQSASSSIHSVTTYTYDKYGHCLTETDPMGNTVTTVYNSLGYPKTVTDKNGVVFSYTYDELMRTTAVSGGDSASKITYSYDFLGNIIKMVDNDGTTVYTYDEFNNLASEVRGSETKTYTYDANGNRLTMTAKNGSFSKTLSYTYTNTNRLSTVKTGAYSSTYTYNANGSPTKILTKFSTYTVTTEYKYNLLELPTYMTAQRNSTNIEYQTAAYNVAGNMTSKRSLRSDGAVVDIQTTYKYDGANRLISENDGTTAITYLYDARGNRTSRAENGTTLSYTYNKNNQLTNISDGTSYTYDANGNRITKTVGTDKTTYTYDRLNRLTGVSGTTTASYTYDGNGIRTSKTVDGVKTSFVNDGGNVFAELTDGGSKFYIHGDRPLIMVGSKAEGYCYDINGNILGLFPASTATKPVSRYSYDAFGITTVEKENTANPYRYKGEYCDDETGLVYLRARYYDPSIGAFITEDPAKDGLNWYAYCAGNPIMFVDPWGLRYEGLREMTDAMGGKIEWDNDTQTASVTIDGITNEFSVSDGAIIQASDQKMYVEGEVFAERFGASYTEYNEDGFEGYTMEYNRVAKITGPQLHISTTSILIKDNAAGQRTATAINNVYNKQFDNSMMAVTYFAGIAGGILGEGAAKLTTIFTGIADKAGDIRSYFDVDLSYDLKVNERISWTQEVGYSSVSRAMETNTTIVRDENGDIRDRSQSKR